MHVHRTRTRNRVRMYIYSACILSWKRRPESILLLKQRLAGHVMHGHGTHGCIPGHGLASCVLYIYNYNILYYIIY